MSNGCRLTVILVNYNNEADTVDCLESLARQSTDEFETIVVDNGSEPASYDHVREQFSYPIFLRNDSNRGFTGGNNRGIEHALDEGTKYVLLLNNDTVVGETFIEELLEAADESPPEVGIMGPTIHTYPDEQIWSDGGSINRYSGSTCHRSTDPAEPPREVDYVVGAAMLVRSRVFHDVGLLDDDFFIYYEETEFCCRARRHGWRIWHLPVEGVYHKETTEFSHSAFRDYYFTRNRYLFVRRTQNTLTFALFLGWYLTRWLLVQTLYLVASRETEAARATLRGGLDAFRGHTGRAH